MAKMKTLDDSNVVSAQQLKQILEASLDALHADPANAAQIPPVLIHGSPGCGKSSIVRDLCAERGIDFIDVRLAQMEPCDIRGLPVPDKESKSMEWFVNGSWPRDPNGKGIIFLDEITAADRSIQVAAYELVLDRRLGKLYSVPPGYLVVAAGNNVTDRAVACSMSSALASRFLHVELGEDLEGWTKWAWSHEIEPSVIGFLQYRPGLLFNMEGENLERGWPCPRSWERVSTSVQMLRSNETLLRKMVYGLVGNAAGVEFMSFFKLNANLDDALEAMLDKKFTADKLPKEADRKYAFTTAMVYHLWRGKDKKDTNARIAGFYRICSMLTSDFATLAVSAAMQGKNKAQVSERCGMLLKHPDFNTWRKHHGDALSKSFDLSSVF